MKTVVLVCLFVFSGATAGIAQQVNAAPKRLLTKSELKQLKWVKDSLLTELQLIYKQEIKENSPGKYQPQRIALVREYLLLFNFMSDRLEVISFNENNVIEIVGKPDKIINESGVRIFEYTSLTRPYLRLKNLRYQLVFKQQELIAVYDKNN